MPRKRVDVSGYDRDRNGRRESVRAYSQLREVLGETVPGFAALKRKTNTQLGFLTNSLAPAGWGLGDVIDPSELKIGDVAVINTYGQRRVISVEAIEPRSEHDTDMTVSGPLIGSTNPFDQEAIRAGNGVWAYVEQVDYGVRPSGKYDIETLARGETKEKEERIRLQQEIRRRAGVA